MFETYKGSLKIVIIALAALGVLTVLQYCNADTKQSTPVGGLKDLTSVPESPDGMDAGLSSDNGVKDAHNVGDAVLDGFCSVNYCAFKE